MSLTIGSILGILARHDIRPAEGMDVPDLPEVGDVEEGEDIHPIEIGRLFPKERRRDRRIDDDWWLAEDNPALREWREDVDRIVADSRRRGRAVGEPKFFRVREIEPHCAWYCPLHYFGHRWGIFIRESCILSTAIDIAGFVNWSRNPAPPAKYRRELLRAAFYVFFLHEQFHHKVESLGFRLLIATQSDRYRRYKANVYRPTWRTADCLEESLANAESHRRLDEPRYVRNVDAAIRRGARDYLAASIPLQSPGYAQGVDYFEDAAYRSGLFHLESQIRDGVLRPPAPASDWQIAPNMITAVADITDDIYVIVPAGQRPVLPMPYVSPGPTALTRALESALTKFYGYRAVPGGKGSHVKLKKPDAPTVILPGNRATLSPGVLKQVLSIFGGHPLSRLPDLLNGTLPMPAASPTGAP